MKIHQIKLKNINSLKGIHEVNFTTGPLAKTGLFAIIGPTGSGKSTLLDAITLALYNCTPRSGNLSKNAIEKNGAVITRNTDDAFCEILYESKGTIFRSRWEISRARTGNLRDYEMSLSFRDDNGIFSILDVKKGDIPQKNAEIIGLNYDQFIKSILLSQGEFAKFLKSAPKERSALLEKITGTEIYTKIGAAAYEKQKEEKQKLEKIQGQLGDISILSDEETENIKAAIVSLQEKATSGKEKLTLVNQKISLKKQLANKLQAFAEINNRLDALLEKQRNQKNEEDKLKLHNRVLPLKSDIDKLISLEKESLQLENEKIAATEQAEKLTHEIHQLEAQHTAIELQLEKSRREYEELQPVLTEVKKTDDEIKIELTKKEQTEKQLNQILKELEVNAKSLIDLKTEFSNIKDKLGRIDSFMRQNPGLEQLGDVLPGIEQQKKQIDEQRKSLEIKMKSEFPAIFNQIEKEAPPAKIKAKLTAEKEQILAGKAILIKSFDGPIPNQQEILDEIETYNHTLNRLSELIRLAKSQQQIITEKTETQAKILVHHENFKKAANEGTLTSQAIEITEKMLEELQARKEKEALEAKYEEAREMLMPGVPCPLCGSTEHPLVKNYKKTKNETLENLKLQNLELKKLKFDLEKIKNKQSQIAAEIKSLENYLGKLEKEFSETTKTIREITAITELTNSAFELADFENQLAQTNDRLNLSKQNLEALGKVSKLDESLKALTMLLEKTNELGDLDQKIAENLQPFENYFEDISDKENAIKILVKMLFQFREAIKQKTEFREKEATTASVLNEKENRKTELIAEKQKIEFEYAQLNQLLSNLTLKRKGLFGEKDPEIVGKQQAEKIRKEEMAISENEKLLGIKKAKHENLIILLKKTVEKLEGAINGNVFLNSKLKPRLIALNFESHQEASKALMTEEEAAAILEKLSTVKAAIDKARQSVEDVTAEISKLRAGDDENMGINELDLQKKELEDGISLLDQETGTCNARLTLDRENRKKTADLRMTMQNQEKEYARWEALSNLIGDAKGSKFSRFAQQLTLLQMLAKANRHLRKLTDRYILINEDAGENDELFVIDIYHGDEKRSVKTLSGGESFLVSLALALGLSDLAGSKTTISSLFIDEGFGSLDQETLDTALSTLERLQTETNRTIGIISHVEALKERITTQIELTKDAMGNSSLTIKN